MMKRVVPLINLTHKREIKTGCCSVTKPCLTLCDPIDCSTSGFPVLHYLPVCEICPVSWWCVCECSVASIMSDSCDPMNCSPPGSSVHRILQARILEWVAMSSSRRSSRGLNLDLLCLLRWQADSLPLSHLGSPIFVILWLIQTSCMPQISWENSIVLSLFWPTNH